MLLLHHIMSHTSYNIMVLANLFLHMPANQAYESVLGGLSATCTGLWHTSCRWEVLNSGGCAGHRQLTHYFMCVRVCLYISVYIYLSLAAEGAGKPFAKQSRSSKIQLNRGPSIHVVLKNSKAPERFSGAEHNSESVQLTRA